MDRNEWRATSFSAIVEPHAHAENRKGNKFLRVRGPLTSSVASSEGQQGTVVLREPFLDVTATPSGGIRALRGLDAGDALERGLLARKPARDPWPQFPEQLNSNPARPICGGFVVDDDRQPRAEHEKEYDSCLHRENDRCFCEWVTLRSKDSCPACCRTSQNWRQVATYS